MKKILGLILTILLTVLTACAPVSVTNNGKICVAVGIEPEAAFVRAVTGDMVDVVTLIPAGYSPANYSPTVAEMRVLSDADIYYTLHMPAEQANILPRINEFNKDIRVVDLRDAVKKVYPMITLDGHNLNGEGTEDTVDPHVWLSPRRVIVMVQAITDTLVEMDAVNAEQYQANAAEYIKKIEALDEEIARIVASLDNRAFLIYHPAYAYFADDYGLNMLAIEIAGKQASAAEIAQVIDDAQQYGIKTVFYQSEFSNSQAKAVADEIGGTVSKAEPLSPDYIEALRDFAQALAGK